MKFSASKMKARLEKEGRAHLIDSETEEIMEMLDGKEAVKNNYKALIHDKEEYYVRVDGVGYPVNKLDCE